MAGLVCVAFSICLLLKSGLGVSVISSAPLSLYYSAPDLSFGTWNTIFQIAMLLLLIAILKRVKISYVVSLGVGILFGILLDVLKTLTSGFPESTILMPVYLAASLAITAVGVSLFMKCRLPLMPCDILIREIVVVKHISIGRMKTLFDVSCLIFSLAVQLIFVSGIRDIGIGTILSALLTGTLVGMTVKAMTKVFDFQPVLAITKRGLSAGTQAEKSSE